MSKTATLATRRYTLGLALFGESVKYFAAWILAAIILAAVVPLIVSQWRSIDISAWYLAANVGKYLAAIIAGGYLYTLLPILVAQGMTRRETAVSMGIFGLLWSLFLGTIALVGFLGEHALYGVFDWTQAPQQGEEYDLVLGSFGQALDFAAIYPLSYLLYCAGGALAGAAIYRSDTGWLILALVVPIGFAVDDLLSSADTWGPAFVVRFITGPLEDLGTWPAVVIALAVIAIGAWGTRRIILNTPIRAKQA